MESVYRGVAGIDVHKDMIKVAVRSPGKKRWTRKTEVLTFRTFYGVLRATARELRRRGVTHVAMEASGVYAEPVFYALAEEDFQEILVVNPAHVKAVKGQKTDAKDCARIAELLGESPGIRPEDVFVTVLDAAKENWSVGHGLAQFA